MAAQNQQNQQNTPKKKKKKNKDKDDKDKGNHKFNPILPNLAPQVQKYIETQLKKYDYFRKRPHVYPQTSIDFEIFVNKIIKILNKKKEDFCWSLDWKPLFFSKLIYAGFLTIASEIQDDLYVMLPKLHQERCIIDLDSNSINNHLPIHIPKNVKKKSKNYTITVDTQFENVFQECINQHGISWLYPPMQGLLFSLYHNRGDPNYNGVTVHSVELWDVNNRLIAGELGTSVGGIYTSLTGFYLESGTGSMQLFGLGYLLQKCSFKLWDLGMFIEYKSSLGAGILKRNDFVQRYKELRDIKNIKLECKIKTNCKDIFNEILNKNKLNDMNDDNDNKDIDIDMKGNDDKDNQDNINNNDKPISKKHQKRLARIERRRLAKLKAKKQKEKDKANDVNDVHDVQQNNDDNKDAVMSVSNVIDDPQRG